MRIHDRSRLVPSLIAVFLLGLAGQSRVPREPGRAHDAGALTGGRHSDGAGGALLCGRIEPHWGFCAAPPAPGKKGSFGPRMHADRRPPPTPRVFKGAQADTVRVLGIRVDFEGAEMDSTPEYFDRLLLFLGQYYNRVSYGRIVFAPAVTDSVYRLKKPMDYYGDNEDTGVRGVNLIWDAVAAADADYDFSRFQGVAIIHAEPGEESDINGDSTGQIWSAFYPDFLISTLMADTLKREVPGIPTGDLDAEGDTVFVTRSVVIPETEDQDGYRFGAIGVYAHEHGHFFGLPDLYNTLGTNGSIQGIGNWGIMATGTWNANGHVPAEQDAWSRVFLGWTDPVDVLSDAEISLPPVQETGHDTTIVRIPLSGDEYFLIENRVQDLNGDGRFNFEDTDNDSIFDFYTDSYLDAEWDFFLPGEGTGSGLLIWHIDRSIIDYALYYNVVEGDPKHKGVDLMEADGIQDLDGPVIVYESFGSPEDAYREGNNTELTPESDPSSRPSFGGPSDVYVTGIGPASNRMTFQVRFTGSTLEGWPVDLPARLAGNPVAADLGGAAGLEVVGVDETGRLHAWDSRGRALFAPIETGSRFVHEPLLGPVGDGDSRGIVAVGAGGRVFRRLPDGSAVGPPEGVVLPSGAYADSAVGGIYVAPSLTGERGALVIGSRFADPESTYSVVSVLDLLTGVADTLHLPGRTARPPAICPPPDIVPASGSAAADRVAYFAVNARDGRGRYHLVTRDGTGLRSVPLSVRFRTHLSAPCLGDLDRDGALDLVGISGDGAIHALRVGAAGDSVVEAAELPGWPYAFDVVDSSEVSLADVDGNGHLDVLVVGTGGRAIAINHHGVPIPGWPQTIPQSLEFVYEIPKYPAPLAADLDGEGTRAREMLVVLGDGRAIPASEDRRQHAGWPVLSGPGSVPFFADVDGNAVLDAVLFEEYGGAGRVRVREAPGRPPVDSAGWLSYRHDPSRTGRSESGREEPVPASGPAVAEFYVQPNPVPAGGGWVHYVPGPGVESVTIEIYDIAGDLVRRLGGSIYPASDNLVRWDGLDDQGSPVASGLYLCRIAARTGSGQSTTRLLKFAVLR